MSDSIENKYSLEIYNHPQVSEFNHLVYPVVSRRAGGLLAKTWSDQEKDAHHRSLIENLNVPVKTIYQAGVKDL